MVVWWMRIITSILSVPVGAFLGAMIYFLVPDPNVNVFDNYLLTVFYTFILSVPAWLLALPIIILVRNFKGIRFWIYLAIGSLIGPCVIYGFVFYGILESPDPIHGLVNFFSGITFYSLFSKGMLPVYLALSVSTITTLTYLLLYRWQARESKPIERPINVD